MRKVLYKSMLGSFNAPADIVSGAATFVTQFQPIDSYESFMIQIAWTGSPTATVHLEYSADPVPQLGYSAGGSLPQPVVYDTISGSTQNTSSSSNNVISYEILHTCSQWVRLVWVNASGSGVVTSINLVAKGVSA